MAECRFERFRTFQNIRYFSNLGLSKPGPAHVGVVCGPASSGGRGPQSVDVCMDILMYASMDLSKHISIEMPMDISIGISFDISMDISVYAWMDIFT